MNYLQEVIIGILGSIIAGCTAIIIVQNCLIMAYKRDIRQLSSEREKLQKELTDLTYMNKESWL